MRIRTKGFLVISLVLIAALLTVALATNFLLTESIKRERTQTLNGFAEVQARRLEQVIEKNLERLQGVTSRTQLRLSLENFNSDSNPEELLKVEGIIEDAKNSISDFKSISIANPNGEVIASTENSEIGSDLSQDKLFNQSLKENTLFVEYSSAGEAELRLSGPLVLDEKVIGVAVILAAGNDIIDVAQDYTGLGETGETVIARANENGDAEFFISRRFEDEPGVEKVISSSELELSMTQALRGNEDVYTGVVDYRGEPVIAATRYLDNVDWGVVVEQDRSEVFQEIDYLQKILVFSGVGALLIGLILAYVFSNSVTRPLVKLQKLVRRASGRNFKEPIRIKSSGEIADLAEEFESMRKKVLASRSEAEVKVVEQTQDLRQKSEQLEKQRMAMVNLLEDVAEERDQIAYERDSIRLIMESIGDGVFVINADFEIVLFNRMAGEISGFSSSEAIGERYDRVLKFISESSGEQDYSFITNAYRKSETQKMKKDTLLIRKDGTSINVGDSAAPLRDKLGNVIGCVVVFRDVTREREIDRMKTEFVSVASHQLRTPLSAIKWFLEIALSGDLGELNSQQKEHLQEAFRSNERMIALVNDLLNVSRIESGRLAIKPEETDLVSLVEDLLKEMEATFNKRQQRLDLHIAKNLPVIKVDPKLMRQVFTNLLSNASRYSPDKGIIELEITYDEKDIQVRITDHGMGIPQRQQNKVFEKFFRADNAVTKVPEGTGLGLYVAKSVIEASGGKVWFKSVQNEGTTFWFTLPIKGSKAKKGEKSLV